MEDVEHMVGTGGMHNGDLGSFFDDVDHALEVSVGHSCDQHYLVLQVQSSLVTKQESGSSCAGIFADGSSNYETASSLDGFMSIDEDTPNEADTSDAMVCL